MTKWTKIDDYQLRDPASDRAHARAHASAPSERNVHDVPFDGAKAFHEQYGKKRNPWSADSQEHKEWNAAWDQAKLKSDGTS